jgi:hypothetical protein
MPQIVAPDEEASQRALDMVNMIIFMPPKGMIFR